MITGCFIPLFVAYEGSTENEIKNIWFKMLLYLILYVGRVETLIYEQF